MDPVYAVPLVIAGLALIVKGSDVFIDGAVSVAKRLGVSEHLIGLTLVAFATSAPELVTSIIASFCGHSPLILGNVVGSNMANICLALGLVLLIRALVPEREAKRDSFVMVGSIALFFVLAIDGSFSVIDGVIFIVLYGGYFLHLYRSHKDCGIEETKHGLNKALVLVIVGSASLVGGSWLLVEGAVGIANEFGVSKLLIGLTIVAIGTSLPEIAASLTAVLKGSKGIAVGNIIGSNIINTLLVLGVAGMIAPISVSSDFMMHQGTIVVGVSILLMGMTRVKMARWMGIVLLALYFPLFLFL